jgi:hypothetical protein
VFPSVTMRLEINSKALITMLRRELRAVFTGLGSAVRFKTVYGFSLTLKQQVLFFLYKELN